MNALWQDVKFGVRRLAKQPILTLIMVVILAVGVASNTAVFSVFNSLYLHPLPMKNSERLVDLDESAPKWHLEYVEICYQDFHAWREHNQTFDCMAVLNVVGVNLSSAGKAERVEGLQATHDLDDVMGIQPVLGRMFNEEEDKPGASKVVVLGYGLWRRMFGGGMEVLGKRIHLNSEPYTIIGVLPQQARYPVKANFWVPLAANPVYTGTGNYYLNGIGRLKKGVSITQAREDLTRIHKGMIEERGTNEMTTPRITRLRERYISDARQSSLILLGVTAFVLMIACANVAGIMLARGATRGREICIRVAVGASKIRVVQLILIESLLISALGVCLGVISGEQGLAALIAFSSDRIPSWIDVEMDMRFLVFCLFILGFTTLISGLAPALKAASQISIQDVLKVSGYRSSLSSGRRRSMNMLIVGEIACTLILLVGAGLLFKSFRVIQEVDPGFETKNVLTYQISLPTTKYNEREQWFSFFRNHLEQIRALPGVVAAGTSISPPLTSDFGTFFVAERSPPLGPGEENPIILDRGGVSPGYLQAMGVQLIAGRRFSELNNQKDAAKVVIVNETFARRYWPGNSPIGKRIRYSGSDKDDWMEVIGVTKDVKHYGLEQNVRPGVYIPFGQNPKNSLYVVVRTLVEPLALIEPIRRLIGTADSELPLYDILTMSQRLQRSLGFRRTLLWVFGIFATTALVMAAGGLYGVVAYSVSHRTQEFGIRMALGAKPSDVLKMIMHQGLKLILIGVGIGLAGAFALTRVISSLLYNVSPTDLPTFACASIVLSGAVLLASYIPTRRATKIDPMSALRYE